MGGFSIYLLFLTTALLAAPRRPSLYVILGMTAVTAFSVRFDMAERPAQETIEQARANNDSIVVPKTDHAAAFASPSQQ